MDGAAPKLTIVRAEVKRCRNDYAQVFAVPDPSVCKPGIENCYETEQVFLHWDGGVWKIETSGTGIACGSETDPEIVKICRALGYPDLTTPAFKMPSKNVGCAYFSGTLRCDILSGLKPEPTEGCPYDWVGLVITKGGAAPTAVRGRHGLRRERPDARVRRNVDEGRHHLRVERIRAALRERRRARVQARPRRLDGLLGGQLDQLRDGVPVARGRPDAERALEVVDRELRAADPVGRVQVDLAPGDLELIRGERSGSSAATTLAVGFPLRK